MHIKLALIAAFLPVIAFATPVKVITHIDYVDEDTSELKTYHTEEDLNVSYASMSAFDKFRTTVGLNLNAGRSDGRPLMISMSNAHAKLRGESLPNLDIRFSFPKKTMKKDYTYKCTPGYYDNGECRFQLDDYDFNLPNVETICKMKVVAKDKFSFENMTFSWYLPEYPSVVEKGSLWGWDFAMSFDCKNKANGQSIFKGYFLHNADVVPKLD